MLQRLLLRQAAGLRARAKASLTPRRTKSCSCAWTRSTAATSAGSVTLFLPMSLQMRASMAWLRTFRILFASAPESGVEIGHPLVGEFGHRFDEGVTGDALVDCSPYQGRHIRRTRGRYLRWACRLTIEDSESGALRRSARLAIGEEMNRACPGLRDEPMRWAAWRAPPAESICTGDAPGRGAAVGSAERAYFVKLVRGAVKAIRQEAPAAEQVAAEVAGIARGMAGLVRSA